MILPPEPLKDRNWDILKILLVVVIVYLLFNELNNMGFGICDYNITSKYQKTEFNTTKWIQSYHNINLDIMSGLITLSDTYDDSYLEPDTFTTVGLGITTTATQVTHEYDRQEKSYCYYDFGVDYFKPEKFILNFTIKESSVNVYRNWVPIGLANDLDGYTKISGYELFVWSYANPTGCILSLREYNDGAFISVDSNSALTQFMWYYCTFKIENGNALLYIYNDVGRTGFVDLLNITLENDDFTYRYLYIAQSSDEDAGTPVKSLGYSKDYNLTDIYYNENGVIYTKNLLENATLKSIMVGINGTAQPDTSLSVYTSNNNSTWVQQILNNGLWKRKLYEEVLYEYSTMYIRFNLATTNNLKTPILDEFFYYYAYSDGCGVTITAYPMAIILIICGSLMALTYVGIRKR